MSSATVFHIPRAPRASRLVARRAAPREDWWREAMRWSLIALTASTVAGEVTLLLLGL